MKKARISALSDPMDQKLAKLRRRADKRAKTARAEGMLTGVLAILRPGDIVFDCGANVGEVTGPLADTGAEVHAFEPDPWAFAQLQGKFAGRANVTLHNVAVGAQAGTVRLMRAEGFDDDPAKKSVMSTVLEGGRAMGAAPATGIDVPMISLPDLLRQTLRDRDQIAFVKIDIEGAELDLLTALHEGRLFDDIRLTVAETHEKKFRALRPDFRALRAAIAADYPPSKVFLDWI